jgi:hypothetical protein
MLSPILPGVCSECGVIFQTRRRHATTCSERCRKRRSRRLAVERKAVQSLSAQRLVSFIE